MKKLSFSILFFLSSAIVFAQSATTDTVHMGLQQCLDYAYEHQNDMKNAQLDAEISQRRSQEYTGIGLPQVSGKADFTDFLKLPTSLIPAEFFGGEPGTFVPLQFGTQYNATIGATAQQLVFDGRYFLGLKATKALSDLGQKNVKRTKIETAEGVMKAYLTTLITFKRAEELNVNIASFKQTYDNTQALYKSGFVEKIDVDRIAVSYNNLLAEKERTDKFKVLSIYTLKFQMGMDVNQPLALTDTLREADFQSVLQNAATPDINNRIEYQMLLTSKSLAKMNMQQYRFGYLPSLYAIGSVNWQAQRNKFDFFQGGDWYNTAFVGFTLNVPIFDGFQKARQIQQAKLGMQQNENNILNFQNAMNLQVTSAKASMQNAIQALIVQKSNLDLANEIKTISKKKFELGVGTSLEVTDAETSFKDAQTNYLNALYDAWVARLDLEKSLGTLVKQ
ncbi:MAG TPA: TolC family protein [Chitinophagales bacterium]|nr:TolC family protein [Chitinophagales bacterium]